MLESQFQETDVDSDRVNRWLALGANIGVLIGIALLIVELNQNRDMMRAQTRNEISQGELSLLSLTASSRDLSNIVAKANRGEELTPAEQVMWESRSESVFRLWQNVHYQGKHGMYDEEEFSKHIDTMKNVIEGSPSLVVYWCKNRSMFPLAFAETINGLISPRSCEI